MCDAMPTWDPNGRRRRDEMPAATAAADGIRNAPGRCKKWVFLAGALRDGGGSGAYGPGRR